MDLDPDFSEFIASLLDHDVRFLVVGAHALAAHDLDIWLWIDEDNAAGVVRALDHLGPLKVRARTPERGSATGRTHHPQDGHDITS